MISSWRLDFNLTIYTVISMEYKSKIHFVLVFLDWISRNHGTPAKPIRHWWLTVIFFKPGTHDKINCIQLVLCDTILQCEPLCCTISLKSNMFNSIQLIVHTHTETWENKILWKSGKLHAIYLMQLILSSVPGFKYVTNRPRPFW